MKCRVKFCNCWFYF